MNPAHSLRHCEFLQLQCVLFPRTEALAAATTCATATTRELEGRERELGRGGGRERGREGGSNRGREGGRERGREGGIDGRSDRGRERREGGKEGGRDRGRDEGREGGNRRREGGKEGGREGTEGGREGKTEGGLIHSLPPSFHFFNLRDSGKGATTVEIPILGVRVCVCVNECVSK